MGRGGYEGIQNDSAGNLWIGEDVGGPNGVVNNRARQPNSFIYRFVPARPGDLAKGTLQVLQVLSLRTGQPIVFHAGQADADIANDDQRDLHTYGTSLPTRWITIHDTAADGTDPFNANALAKAKGGTPFRRPENGVFRPGTAFTEFFFDETGDTDIRTQAAPPGSRTMATTRSPASTSRTAIPARMASSARRCRTRSTPGGARSGRSSTATTSRGSCCRRAAPWPEAAGGASDPARADGARAAPRSSPAPAERSPLRGVQQIEPVRLEQDGWHLANALEDE